MKNDEDQGRALPVGTFALKRNNDCYDDFYADVFDEIRNSFKWLAGS